MNDSDVFAFMDTFRSVKHVFPLRGEEHEIQDVGKSYFKALRRFTLSQVKDAADRCIAECKRFPKPQEWAERVTRRPVIEIAELSVVDANAYHRAEQRGYQDEPCSCASCQAAGVTHRFLRFVPEFEADGRDARARIGDRIVTRGHWAHGEELRRWYAAQEAFWDAMFKHFGSKTLEKKKRLKKSFEQRMKEIFQEPDKRRPRPEDAA